MLDFKRNLMLYILLYTKTLEKPTEELARRSTLAKRDEVVEEPEKGV